MRIRAFIRDSRSWITCSTDSRHKAMLGFPIVAYTLFCTMFLIGYAFGHILIMGIAIFFISFQTYFFLEMFRKPIRKIHFKYFMSLKKMPLYINDEDTYRRTTAIKLLKGSKL